ncbi:MAG: hypothetical protein NVV63_07400 [Opitutus sp.]|nr:hypothetical protein [Opitutus sp.]
MAIVVREMDDFGRVLLSARTSIHFLATASRFTHPPLLSVGRFVLSVLALVSGASLFGAPSALIADFRLDSDFENGGTYGTLSRVEAVGTGGTSGFTGSAWEWNDATVNPGKGLKLNIPATLSTYTLALSFSLSDVTGYRKIVDFKNLTHESGIYAYSNALSVYTDGATPSGH